MTNIFINKTNAIQNNGYDCSFRKDELQERLRYLRRKIHYFEEMAKINNAAGNGDRQMYCVQKRAKLIWQKTKFKEALKRINF